MQELARSQEALQAAAKEAWQAFLSDFAALYMPFKSAVQAVAALDSLCSLAVVSSGDGCVAIICCSHACCVSQLDQSCCQVLVVSTVNPEQMLA